MAITYPITLPASGVRSFSINQRTVVGGYASPYTLQQQVYAHPGQALQATVTFKTLTRAQAAPLIAALWSLNGAQGTFYFGDTAYTAPQGVGTGTPLVNGSSQTGIDLDTDGWTPSQTGILKAGDMIQIGTSSSRQLCMVLADADSDVSGNATLSLFPRIRTAFADNTSIVVNSPKGVWRLLTPSAYRWDFDKLARGLEFQCAEAF